VSIVKLARPEIQALHAYDAAEQIDDTIRLNANESPRRCVIGNFRRPLNRYPEVRPQNLQYALAQRFGCEADQLLVTRGSSEAIDLVIRTFCRAGEDSVLMTSPLFSMYRHYAAVQGAKLIEVQTRGERDFAIDVHEILAASDDTTRVIFVCSPNNPTGTTLPRDALVRLLETRGDASAIVVDEAYVVFGKHSSVTELLGRHSNLLVLRTLSKALGFAGARCGAVAGQADVIRMLSAVQAPYAMATPVVECVEDALQDEQLELAQRTVREITEERNRVAAALGLYGFVKKVWPSDANFLLIRVADAELIMRRCASENVLLRDFNGELENCIRISIGSRDENNKLLEVLNTLEIETDA
jgi:histidinol-phosphate aminotransferase